MALYHHEVTAGSVYMLAFRHQKEADYITNKIGGSTPNCILHCNWAVMSGPFVQ
jgi:hypothetical protein